MNENRRRMNDLMQTRTGFLDAAQAAYDAGNNETYIAEMARVTNMNSDIERLKTLIAEEERMPAAAPTPNETRDAMEERMNLLLRGEPVTYDAAAVRAAIFGGTPTASFTLANGDIVKPTGGGTDIRGGDSRMSSIIDQVTVTDLTGLGAYDEPYVLSELTANAQAVAAAAGTLRAASEPSFGVAQIKPYEVNVTSYFDRNLSRLTPAAYDAKIFNMAMRALRRRIISLIYNGDGQATPEFFGIKTAKNKKGDAIYQTQTVNAIDENMLDTLVFAYGGDEELGSAAQLYLKKQDLKALGALRGTNEKRRLFSIATALGNANSGTITDGGLIVPYSLASDLTALSETTPGALDVQTMLFGDPKNFELGLFGGFTIRIDEIFKAGERLNTILGDAMVGGNLIVDKGYVVASVPKASTPKV
ncbi:MAG: phage major capsid protein [Angelakisella sp.]